MAQSQQLTPAEHRQQLFFQQLDDRLPELAYQLPANVSKERFRAVCVTAVNANPDLLSADLGTFFVAASKCASDGLLPDGREAAFVVYNTRIKRMRPDGTRAEVQVEGVQYLAMMAGIRKRMRNTGQVLSADAEVVYSKDRFEYRLGDDPRIVHEPPPLGQERGEVVGAYAIIKLANGEVLRDVLPRADIEKAREVSRAKNGPMWTKFYHEAARKTALRRCSKQAPQSSEMMILDRGEEPDDAPFALGAPFIDHEMSTEQTEQPRNGQIAQTEQTGSVISDADHQAETFAIVDLDGVEHEFATPQHAAAALFALFEEASKLGLDRLNGAAESNDPLVTYMDAAGHTDHVDQILALLKDLRRDLKAAQKPVQQREPRSLLTDIEDEMPQQVTAAAEPETESGWAAPEQVAAGLRHAIEASKQSQIERNPWYDQESLEVRPKLKNGRPDWATWMEVQFLPRVKGALTTRDMSMTMGDNENHIAAYRAAIGAENAKVFDQIVANQWAAISEREA